MSNTITLEGKVVAEDVAYACIAINSTQCMIGIECTNGNRFACPVYELRDDSYFRIDINGSVDTLETIVPPIIYGNVWSLNCCGNTFVNGGIQQIMSAADLRQTETHILSGNEIFDVLGLEPRRAQVLTVEGDIPTFKVQDGPSGLNMLVVHGNVREVATTGNAYIKGAVGMAKVEAMICCTMQAKNNLSKQRYIEQLRGSNMASNIYGKSCLACSGAVKTTDYRQQKRTYNGPILAAKHRF